MATTCYTPKQMRVSILVLVVLTQAHCAGETSSDAECVTSDDCDAGSLCVLGECAQVCSRDADCGSTTAECSDGLCREVGNPDCSTSHECNAPGTCQESDGSCVGGQCHYSPKVAATTCDDGNLCTTNDACNGTGACLGESLICDTPPPNECLGTDDLLVAHGSPGTCNQTTGVCDYPRNEVPCNNCTANCLTACSGVVCDDTRGGCRPNGHCDPAASGNCAYYLAANGTPCTLPGGGVCVDGDCVECIDAIHCPASSAAHPECFSVSCAVNTCVYQPKPATVCAGAACSDGDVELARTCGGDGSCPSGGTQSCNGLRCADGSSCLASCGGDPDCMPGLSCDTGSCVGLLSDGAGCTANAQCINVCAAGICAPLGGAGADCDQPTDCQAAFTCASSDTCKLRLGASCSTGTVCASGHCADDVCCNDACSGVCKVCGADGLCDDVPTDDSACGTICDSLDTVCRDYAALTSNRCASFGACKAANATNCNFTATGASCGNCGECDTSGDCFGDCSGNCCTPADATQSTSGVCSATTCSGSCSTSTAPIYGADCNGGIEYAVDVELAIGCHFWSEWDACDTWYDWRTYSEYVCTSTGWVQSDYVGEDCTTGGGVETQTWGDDCGNGSVRMVRPCGE